MTKGRPIEIEAQLTYATALLAGCLYLFYELFTFSKETGWEGIFQLMIAIMAMIGLQFVVLGMSLHIYFRGHWMAQAMVERWKAKRVKERAEELRAEGTATASAGADSAGSVGAGADSVGSVGASAKGVAAAVGASAKGVAAAEQIDGAQTAEDKGDYLEHQKPRWYVWLSDLFTREILISRGDERRTIDEVESLEVLCIASFYKTFQYLHAYLFTLVLFIAFYGAAYFNGWEATICLVLLIYLTSVRVLNILGNTLFFLPIISKTAKKWEELNIEFQRCFGLWTLPPEFHRRRLDKLHRLAITFIMLALGAINFLLVWQPAVTADKEVYVRGNDSYIMLKFWHGGVQTNYYVDTKFVCRLSTLKPNIGQPKWYPIGGNSYATVVKLSDLHSGVCEARLQFLGYTMKDAAGTKSATVMNVDTKFLVID